MGNSIKDYISSIQKKFKNDKGGEKLNSYFQNGPTPGQIRKACLWLLENSKTKEDQKILSDFFKFTKDTDHYKRIKHYEFNLFKAIKNLLIGEVTNTTNTINVNLAALLAQHQPRPYGTLIPIETLNILTNYLNWLIRSYDRIELPFLGSERQRIPSIPLDKVYVGLKVENKMTDYERECALINFEREMTSKIQELDHYPSQKEILNIRSEILQNNPKMAALISEEERKGYKKSEKHVDTDDQTSEIITLAEAFKEERYLVILGDPGSGKSTLSKWLTIKLAKAMLESLNDKGQNRILIDNHQIKFHRNPSDENKTTDLGPVRLPIFVKISQYVERYSIAPLPLAEFLGTNHNSQGIIDQTEINRTMKEYLRKGEAIVILDGVDEISFKRREILLEIQAFIQEWIKEGTFIQQHKKMFEPPYKSGGNQIIITSRIVGYHSAPLSGNLTHVTIQKMEEVAVRHFCDIWMEHVHYFLANDQIVTKQVDEKTVKLNAKREAEALKDAIYDNGSKQIKELASNPLLVTILAVIFRVEKGQLPKQRVVLYEKATDILINKLRPNVSVNRSELDYILCGLASDIHKSVGDDITKVGFGNSIKRHLHSFRKKNSDVNSIAAIDADTTQLIEVISTDVGLLAESTTHVYRFLHRTFQEYLTGKYLVSQKDHAADNILKHISDPIWRVPIILAIGCIDKEWELGEVAIVIEKLLTAEDPLKKFIPRGALLIADVITDLENISDNNINVLVRSLLNLYIKNIKQIKIESQRKRLEKAITTLINGPKKEVVFTIIEEQLRNKDDIPYITKLLNDKEWYTDTIGRRLLKALQYDSEVLGFPIHSYLQAQLWRLRKNRTNIFNDILGLKNYLLSNPEIVSEIKKNIPWQRLIIMLYGGISYVGIAKKARQYELLKKQLDRNEGSDDELHKIAIQLDTQGGNIIRKLQQKPEFDPQFIYKDSPFTKRIITALRNQDHCTDLQSFFIDIWETSDNLYSKAQSLVALVAIGFDVDPFMKKQYENDLYKNAISIFLQELKRIKSSLQDPIYRSKEILNKFTLKSTTPTFFDQLPENKRVFVLKKSIEILINNGISFLDTCYSIKEKRVTTLHNSDDIIYAEAEGWVSRFLRPNDAVYNIAVLLDVASQELTKPIQLFLGALINIHKSKNIYSKEFVDWSIHTLPYKAEHPEDYLLLALTNISSIPDRFYFVKDWMIWSLRPLLEKHPEIIPEAIIRGISIPKHELIKKLKPELFEDPDLNESLFVLISKTQDPYKRFRALWLLIQLYNKSEWEKILIQTYNEITNPIHQVITTEMILNSTNDKVLYGISVINNENIAFNNLYPQMWKNCRNITNAIHNIENQIRAKCRLAALYYNGIDHNLIHEAFSLIPYMKTEDAIKEGLVQDIIMFLKTHELSYNEQWKTFSNTIKSNWYKNIIENKNYKNLISLDHNITTYKEIWTCLSVYTICEDHLNQNVINTENTNWFRLCNSKRPYQILRKIIETQKNGIPLTIQKFMILEELIDAKRESIVKALIPYLEKPDNNVFPLLRKWSESENSLKKRFSSLLFAENNEITPFILKDLLWLMDSNNDRLRVRASVAIHGLYNSSTKIDRSKKLSEIGLETLKEIIQKENTYWDNESPAHGIRLRWFFSDLIIDDPNTLQEVINDIEINLEKKSISLEILKKIEFITLGVWAVLKKGLLSTHKPIRTNLFESLCAMTHLGYKYRTHLPAIAYKELPDIIQEIPSEDWEQYDYFLYEEKTIIKVIEEVSLVCPNQINKALELAEESVKNQSRIDLNNITKLEPSQIIEKLGCIGESFFIKTGRVLSDSQEALQTVNIDNNPNIFNLLIHWCINRLQSDLFEEHPKRLGSMLCLLTSIGAELRPEQVAKVLHDIDCIEDLLIKVVKKHPYWLARRGAITLLGSLGNLSEDVIYAIVSALKDVPFVQEGVFQSFTSFKTVINTENIKELENCLNANSGSVAAKAAKILGNIMVSNQYDEDLRKKGITILTNKLNEQKNKEGIPKHIFYLDKQQSSLAKIVNGGDLEQILYEELIKISGIN